MFFNKNIFYQRFKKRVSGTYTLEIMAIVILFSLIIIAGVQYFNHNIKKRYYKKCQQNLKKIGSALELYAKEHKGKYPEKIKDLKTKYIKKLPCNIKDYSYKKYYNTKENISIYTLYCSSNKYNNFSKKGYPQYSSKNGLILNINKK